jgi:hypothetical protein
MRNQLSLGRMIMGAGTRMDRELSGKCFVHCRGVSISHVVSLPTQFTG